MVGSDKVGGCLRKLMPPWSSYPHCFSFCLTWLTTSLLLDRFPSNDFYLRLAETICSISVDSELASALHAFPISWLDYSSVINVGMKFPDAPVHLISDTGNPELAKSAFTTVVSYRIKLNVWVLIFMALSFQGPKYQIENLKFPNEDCGQNLGSCGSVDFAI